MHELEGVYNHRYVDDSLDTSGQPSVPQLQSIANAGFEFAAPTEQDLLAFFEAMDQHRGQKVWVHCAANMRVSVFLGPYRVLRQGWEEERAFDLMCSL